jgi:hypothetical protein
MEPNLLSSPMCPDAETEAKLDAMIESVGGKVDRIKDALMGAELLLDFAARNGLQNDKLGDKEFAATALEIAEAKDKYDKGLLTPQDRSQFYEVYWQLAQLMRPVTVNSIRDSYASFGEQRKRYWLFGPTEWFSRADLAVARWRRHALIVLLALLLVQIYWVAGSALIQGIQSLDSPKRTAAASAPTAPADEVEKQKVRDQIRRRTLYDLLSTWWYYFPGPKKMKAFGTNSNSTDDFAKTESAESLFERANQAVTILQVYILPLVYGLLGAYAYVLRELIRENRERTYRSESETAYRMRVILGLLAGLAIGWFARPESDSTGIVAKLTPFALSFLAGYSVEVLFSAMDRFVSAFGSVSQQSKS